MPFGTITNNNAASFEAFYEAWLVRQEHYLDELLCTQQNCHESQEDDLKDLIARVLSHYQEYYAEKSRLANRDTFLVFSPTWLTPLERAFFWIAGLRPDVAFRLAANSVNDLTQHQNLRINELVHETKAEERELEEQWARVQESVAAPPMLAVARQQGRVLRDSEVSEADGVVEELRSAMEAVVGKADLLRTRTAERVVEVLNPVQSVKFLAAATQLQLRIRRWGLQKEAERHRTNDW